MFRNNPRREFGGIYNNYGWHASYPETKVWMCGAIAAAASSDLF